MCVDLYFAHSLSSRRDAYIKHVKYRHHGDKSPFIRSQPRSAGQTEARSVQRRSGEGAVVQL